MGPETSHHTKIGAPQQGAVINIAADSWDAYEIHADGEPLPLLPDGCIVDVRVARCDVRPAFDGSLRAELTCEIITECPWFGERLSLFFKLHKAGKRRASVPRGSKFYRLWSLANGGNRPTRRDRMGLSIFRDRLFRGKTKVVKTDYRGRALPAELHHSIVEEFVL